MRMIGLSLAALLLSACGRDDPAPLPANEVAAAPAPVDARLESIRDMIRPVDGTLSGDAKFALAYADIGGDEREEALVYLVDPDWCGSGGCSLIVLTPSGNKWRELARTSVTQLPVHRLLTGREGWNDLAVAVGGGGGESGIALLRFAGRRYPDNPSTQPKLNRLPEGAREVLADDEDHLIPVSP